MKPRVASRVATLGLAVGLAVCLAVGLAAAPAWTAPPYAPPPGAVHERAVTVGADSWALPGTLTLPTLRAPEGRWPAVVLVHGSGPEDEDETIGPNKPFKDLALGLAARGVAVLRYTKRTERYPGTMHPEAGTFTVRDETIDDARAAVAVAARQPEIDPHRIFVLGHSLGGSLAPRIARGDPQVAGLVILAGSARPLEKVIVEQLRYLAGIEPGGGKAAAGRIAAAEAAARQIESPSLAPTTMIDLLGARIPGSYFLDLRGYEPARDAAQLAVPILVLQAERDYQVTMADFAIWKAALAGRPRTSFRLYPGLFHLFMPSVTPVTPGTGLGSPADYRQAGHVAEAVIADIAAWIAGQPAGS